MNIKPTPPSHTLFYWKPWREDADLNGSWLDYNKDISLIQYTADSIGQYVAQANNNQVNAINDVAKKIGIGFNLVSTQLDTIDFQLQAIDAELGIVNQNLELQIEQQKISNILLENIGELLRVPNSEKERQRHIEIGLKFYVNANKDEDLYYDALNELQKAESLMSQDYFVLHRLGMIYLYSTKHIDINKAFEYFSKAGKYASVESDPKAERLVNFLTKNSKVVNSTISKEVFSIGLLACESYSKAAFCLYIKGKIDDAIDFQKKAIKLSDTPKNRFWLAKYQARGNKIEDCIFNLNNAIESEPGITLLLFKDLDLINLPESIKLIEEKNEYFISIIKIQIELWKKVNDGQSKQKIETLSNYLSEEFHKKASFTKYISFQEQRCKSRISELVNSINEIINSDDFLNLYSEAERNEINLFLSNLQLIKNIPVELLIEKINEIENVGLRYFVKIGDNFSNGIVFKKIGLKLYVTKKDFVIKYEDSIGWKELSYNQAIKTLKNLGQNWRFPTIEELKDIYKIKDILYIHMLNDYKDQHKKRFHCEPSDFGKLVSEPFVWSSTKYEKDIEEEGFVVTRPASFFISEKSEWRKYLMYKASGLKTLNFANGEESTRTLLLLKLNYETGLIEKEINYCEETSENYSSNCFLLPVYEV